tara:strand:+ start:660 stop:833 length:174 start_codon:yes stop_codon:yes gene_type:complete
MLEPKHVSTRAEVKAAKAEYNKLKARNPQLIQQGRESVINKIISTRIPDWNLKVTYK